MIEPILQDDAFLADVAACRNAPGARLWWLGQSGFLVQFAGKHVLLDPYLSDSLTVKYASTDKPHVRMTRRVVAPERLDFIDVVTSTHNHTDHFDPDTLLPLLGVNPNLRIIVPEANRATAAQRLNVPEDRLTGIDVGQSVDAPPFTFHAVPAAHETVQYDDRGRCMYLVYVVRCGDVSLYHSGDTVLYESMIETLRPFRVDVALLPINGRLPERRVAGNLWGREAARLGMQIGAAVTIPCHFEMFEFNTATPDEFVAECRMLGQQCRVLRCGERFELSEARR